MAAPGPSGTPLMVTGVGLEGIEHVEGGERTGQQTHQPVSPYRRVSMIPTASTQHPLSKADSRGPLDGLNKDHRTTEAISTKIFHVERFTKRSLS